MRIIFVGIHNKSGKSALDSSTRTGKIVDIVIHQSGLPRVMFVKTNLCNRDTMPVSADEMSFQMRNFITRIKPNTGDVFVLLGAMVKTHFRPPIGTNVIAVAHPSSFFGTRARDGYVEDVVAKIHSHVKSTAK